MNQWWYCLKRGSCSPAEWLRRWRFRSRPWVLTAAKREILAIRRAIRPTQSATVESSVEQVKPKKLLGSFSTPDCNYCSPEIRSAPAKWGRASPQRERWRWLQNRSARAASADRQATQPEWMQMMINGGDKKCFAKRSNLDDEQKYLDVQWERFNQCNAVNRNRGGVQSEQRVDQVSKFNYPLVNTEAAGGNRSIITYLAD